MLDFFFKNAIFKINNTLIVEIFIKKINLNSVTIKMIFFLKRYLVLEIVESRNRKPSLRDAGVLASKKKEMQAYNIVN